MLWDFVAISFVFAIASLVRKSVLWMTVSAVMFAPFPIYLTLTPRFHWAILVLAFHAVSIYFIKKKKFTVASVLLLPSAILSIFMFIFVLRQWLSLGMPWYKLFRILI
jgi:hypothetical protein